MGWLDQFRKRNVTVNTDAPKSITAGVLESNEEPASTFDNSNITFSGELSNYDYDSILRDKQNNINSLFELSDYYVDKDPIYRGIIKGVYSTFAMTDWRLIGANEKTKQKYEEY